MTTQLITSMEQGRVSREATAGFPWYTRIEMVEGVHDKFWEGWGIGKGGAYVRYGRRGSEGTTIIKDYTYVITNLVKKLAKGYHYVVASKEIQVSTPAQMVISAVTTFEPEPVLVPVPAPEAPKPVPRTIKEMAKLRKQQSEW